MTDEHASVHTPDGPMDLFVSRPEDAPRGGIVVVQEAFGVTSHIQEVCRRLSAVGWLAIAPSYFHRLDTQIIGYDDMEQAMALIRELNAAGLTDDTNAAFDWLNAEGIENSRIGIVGFCMGGSVVVYANTMRKIGAAITYYGGGVVEGRLGLRPLLELVPEMQAPWLGQYGDQDRGIPPEQVEEMRTAAKTLPFDTEIYRYAEPGHAFNCDDRPKSYNESAAKQAWQRTLDWFADHIK